MTAQNFDDADDNWVQRISSQLLPGYNGQVSEKIFTL